MSTRILEQRVTDAPSDLDLPIVDVVITAGTWDVRCLALTQARMSSDTQHAILLAYANRGRFGIVDNHDRYLADYLASKTGENVSRIEAHPSDLALTWVQVRASIIRLYGELGRPLRVLVDFNSVPRYVALSIMGFGARTGIVTALVASYAAASAYSVGVDGEPAAFTSGHWFPMPIPTLGEGASPSSRSLLVVTAGFEGAGTRRLVNALEPDRLALAISSGIDADFEQTARRANVGLAEDFLLEQKNVIWLPSSSVEDGVRALEENLEPIVRSKDSSFAVSFLLCGTKLSALTAGIYALDNPVSQVYYARPDKWLESTAAGIRWFSTIEVSL